VLFKKSGILRRNMAEQMQARTINQSLSADPLTRAVEEFFVGNGGKQPHSDVV